MPDWNELFKEKENRWVNICTDVIDLIKLPGFSEKDLILDLGSGAGRHLKYLSEENIPCIGMDLAWNGLTSAQKMMSGEGFHSELCQADMSDALPFASNLFDAVISIHVIFHNPVEKLKFTLNEIKRVLKQNGYALLTFNTVYSDRFGKGIELEQGTWIPDTGIDRGIPHHFSSFSDLLTFTGVQGAQGSLG
jgi:ubiquinone/menaquinone biosynthesis C-methylase UbiE